MKKCFDYNNIKKKAKEAERERRGEKRFTKIENAKIE